MSWNPGGGARKLTSVIDTSGYHCVAIQEARDDQLEELSSLRWSYTIRCQQFIGARLPNYIESHCGEDFPGKVRWHYATVHFKEPRVGFSSMGIVSIHLNNVHAKKTQAGYLQFGECIDSARQYKSDRTVDIVCGDLNMARWSRASDALWHEGTLEELEKRGYHPVADYVNECCFIAVHDSLYQALHIKGSSWGQQVDKMKTEEEKKQFHADFLEQVGARKTSKDVHWPMSLALRMPVSATTRSSGLRQRSAAASARRNAKKRLRGFGPPGRSSGSDTYYGRSSGSNWGGDGRSSGWRW